MLWFYLPFFRHGGSARPGATCSAASACPMALCEKHLLPFALKSVGPMPTKNPAGGSPCRPPDSVAALERSAACPSCRHTQSGVLVESLRALEVEGPTPPPHTKGRASSPRRVHLFPARNYVRELRDITGNAREVFIPIIFKHLYDETANPGVDKSSAGLLTGCRAGLQTRTLSTPYQSVLFDSKALPLRTALPLLSRNPLR